MNLICFSDTRWNFVFKRPQHLMTRFARIYKVFYIEEPVYNDSPDGYNLEITGNRVTVVTPHLNGAPAPDSMNRLSAVIDILFRRMHISPDIFWYYTPMALQYSGHYKPQLTIYDCMSDWTGYKHAPKNIGDLESVLFQQADLVFTGGFNLFEAKKHLHANIYPFPGSIDKAHFAQARKLQADRDDQKHIPHPRLGFYGVLDERFDTELIRTVAATKPDWHFVMMGPVANIETATLPHAENIHYLGPKGYAELPGYLSGWDLALLPFVSNESTRYISPTQTPEYLAAGKPVLSAPLADVIQPYGAEGLVHIVFDAEDFIEKATLELQRKPGKKWLARVDQFLKPLSWNASWKDMHRIMEKTLQALKVKAEQKRTEYVYGG